MKSLLLMGCTLLGFAVGLGIGCYNPKIDEGAFFCDNDGSCPAGFKCMFGQCYKNGKPSTDGPVQPTDGSAPPTDGGNMACQGPITCSGPNAANACDPVCQARCTCNQKCTFSADQGAFVCKDVGGVPREANDPCDQFNDACRAGTVCVEELELGCGAHCYRFCRQDSDCGLFARCTNFIENPRTHATYPICSPRIELCNPTGKTPQCVGGNRPGGPRPFPTFSCYTLSGTHADEAVCDCAGTKIEGDKCTLEHSCRPGLECVNVAGESLCRQLCTLEAPSLPAITCAKVGARCLPYGGSKRIGFCM
jgi:hypothetical protein